MQERQIEAADELAEAERGLGIANARQALAPQHSDAFDGVHCVRCGEDMPQARLDAKRIRCTDCESALEAKQRRGW